LPIAAADAIIPAPRPPVRHTRGQAHSPNIADSEVLNEVSQIGFED
jgi:hypothetical protein